MNEFYNRMRYFEDTEGIQEEMYYHYTTLEALYNIVKNKTFWLTSLKPPGDKKELHYKASDFPKDFSELCETKQDENIKGCFQLINKGIKSREKEFYSVFKGKVTPYELCLCEKKVIWHIGIGMQRDVLGFA